MDQYNGGNGGGYPPQGGDVPVQDNAPLQGSDVPVQDNAPPQGGYVPPQGGYVPPQGGYIPPQGGYIPPQGGYAPPQPGMPQTAYMPPQAPPAKNRKLWIWIGGAVALVVVLALVLVLALSGGTTKEPVAPMLYVEDGDVYLAVGAESILLDDAEFAFGLENKYLDAYMTVDGKNLYYLADANSSGEGDLMRVQLGNAKAEPERVAEDVYSARISADGKRMLFITDVDDNEGDLYLSKIGGKPEKIEDSVQTGGYGFSPNGNYIYYQMDAGEDAETLMLYKGGKSTELDEIEDALITDVYVDDTGRVIFNTYSKDDREYTVYLYDNGDVERIGKDAYYVAHLGSAVEFIYTTGDDELIYYNSGEETQVAQDWVRIKFPTWQGRDPRAERETHFVFSEGADAEKTLYEVNVPGDPIKIGKCDSNFVVDEMFRYAVFESEDSLYLSRKEGGEWGRREEVCENPAQYAIDEDSRYLYYIACDDGEHIGELCRIPLKGGDEEVLMEDVGSFALWEGSIYALTDEDDAYLIKNKKESERIERDITDFQVTEGGIYLIGDDDAIYFYNGRETDRVSRDARVIEDYGVIVSALD